MRPSGLFFCFVILCESHLVVSDSSQHHGLYSPWSSPGQNTGVSSFPSPGDLPNPGIKPRSPILQEDSLPAEPQGKPKNAGGSSPSLLQWIFPTQESNRGLLHCRRILYQLSYQGSPLLRHGMCQSLRQWYYQHCWNQAGPCGVSGYRSFFVPCIFLDYWK